VLGRERKETCEGRRRALRSTRKGYFEGDRRINGSWGFRGGEQNRRKDEEDSGVAVINDQKRLLSLGGEGGEGDNV